MLTDDITRYVELHRSLGFKFRTQNILLRNFAAFAEGQEEQFVSTACVLNWAGQASTPQQRRNRLLTVRRFAMAAKAENSQHQVPPANVFGTLSFRRIQPHIYTTLELDSLLTAANKLSPTGSIRPATYTTLLGLITATGLRISEALALQLDDITRDGLVIRETKFHKSRLIPVHQTTRDALDHYLGVRERLGTLDCSVFVSVHGTGINDNTVRAVFRELTRAAGLRARLGRRPPRIHDLRHTFAVRSLEQCGGDAKCRTTVISTRQRQLFLTSKKTQEEDVER